MNPQLTIAIPVYNRTTYFKQALESALNQTIPVPVIVVDNASAKADFRQMLSGYPPGRVTYQRNPTNLGMVGNWNRCIELCATKYLLILHDDDFLESDCVEEFLKVRETEAAFYWSNARIVDEKGRCFRAEAITDMVAYQKDVIRWCLHNPAYAGIIFDVQKARALGGFRSTLKFTPDWDLWFRLFLSDRAILIPKSGINYREYVSAERETTQLQSSFRFYFHCLNQMKRNFSRAQQWSCYRTMRFTRQIPCPSLSQITAWSPQLSQSRLTYFWALYLRSEPVSLRQRLTKYLLQLTGWRSLKLLAAMNRRRRN